MFYTSLVLAKRTGFVLKFPGSFRAAALSSTGDKAQQGWWVMVAQNSSAGT